MPVNPRVQALSPLAVDRIGPKTQNQRENMSLDVKTQVECPSDLSRKVQGDGS